MDPSGRYGSDTGGRDVVLVRDLRPSREAEDELRWFFGPALSEIEQPSTYPVMILHRRGCASAAMLTDGAEHRVHALEAARTIYNWLARLRPEQRLALQELFVWVDEKEGLQPHGAALAALTAYEAVRGRRPSVAPDAEEEGRNAEVTMRPRNDDALELRAVYTVPTLARVAGVTHNRLRRLLRSEGVKFLRSGRVLLVPLSEIETKMPPLWRSLQAIEGLRIDARGGSCRGGDDERR
jgi:hypothetical protein